MTDDTLTALRALVRRLSQTFDPGGSLCLESADPDHPDGWASEHMAVIEALAALLSSPPPEAEPPTCATCRHYRQDPHRMSGPCEMGVRFDHRCSTVPHNFGCTLHQPTEAPHD